MGIAERSLRLLETLGAKRWEQAQRRAQIMTAEEGIADALAALETLSGRLEADGVR